MSYAQRLSRDNPGCFLFLIDQSGSMNDRMTTGESKAEYVANVLNRTLHNLVLRCAAEEGIRDYFHVGVLGYKENGVVSGFGGALSENPLHPISAIERTPLRIETRNRSFPDGAGGLVQQEVKFPVWFEPINSGGTPMVAALRRASELMNSWCQSHPQSFPPVVLNVTDGQSTDGDPATAATQIRSIATSDGSVILCNLHVDTGASSPIVFPSNSEQLPDPYARAMYEMSSLMPAALLPVAQNEGLNCQTGSRMFVYRSDAETIVKFFNVGTSPANLR